MDQSCPVTVVIRNRVRPGKEAEFEDWLRGITQAASQFDGYLGFNVVRPGGWGWTGSNRSSSPWAKKSLTTRSASSSRTSGSRTIAPPDGVARAACAVDVDTAGP